MSREVIGAEGQNMPRDGRCGKEGIFLQVYRSHHQ